MGNERRQVLSEETLLRSREIMVKMGMLSDSKNPNNTSIKNEVKLMKKLEAIVVKVVNDIITEEQEFSNNKKKPYYLEEEEYEILL